MEIRFHGRGGQGVVTAAELLAISAFFDGKHSQAFPFFGVERRGAPVMSFCRIDKKPIRVHQQIYFPDYVVVLDSGLIGKIEVAAGIKKDGIMIINTKKEKDEIGIKANKIFVVDATSISLKTLGKPIVNTAMLGAFAKVSGLVSLESVKKAIMERFSSQLAEKNILAVERCYEEVK